MTLKKQTEEQKFLLSRSENVTLDNLIEIPDGETYDEIIKALYKFRDDALEKKEAN